MIFGLRPRLPYQVGLAELSPAESIFGASRLARTSQYPWCHHVAWAYEDVGS
jgi:hypothetical protein